MTFFGQDPLTEREKEIAKEGFEVKRKAFTDVRRRERGLFSAITEEVPAAVNFHCSFHRSQNIIKMCGTKSGNKVYLALWVYNRLLQCHSVAQLEREKEKISQ